MNAEKIQNDIKKNIAQLSPETLKEIKLFVDFMLLREKMGSENVKPDNIKAELSNMDMSELLHLEEEFEYYKERYPNER